MTTFSVVFSGRAIEYNLFGLIVSMKSIISSVDEWKEKHNLKTCS